MGSPLVRHPRRRRPLSGGDSSADSQPWAIGVLPLNNMTLFSYH